MSRGVLDTSVLIDPAVAPLPGELAISVVSFAELQFGVLVAKNPRIRAQRLTRLNHLQRRFDPLPVDAAVSDSYAHLASLVVAAGRQPRARAFDLMIAATAHAHGAALLTRNATDFVGLDEALEVVAV
jgi:predicted nucleic acid-binding protein